jgi:hypothetical protein
MVVARALSKRYFAARDTRGLRPLLERFYDAGNNVATKQPELPWSTTRS